jgi:mannose-1-phosphate guanylyltransferase
MAAYPETRAGGVRLLYAVEPEPLDTAGAIRFAADAAGVDSTFVVVNGDVLTDADTSALIAFHRDHGASATIQLTPVDDPSRFGVVESDDDGKVLAFVEKPAPGTASTNRINAGTYVLEPAVLERIPSGKRVSIERNTFPALVSEGTLYALSSDAYWLDTGTPTSYLQAHADLVAGRRRDPLPVAGAWSMAPAVWAVGRPHISGEVHPTSLVGDHVTVSRGATIIDSVLGAGTVVGPDVVVQGSVILPGAHLEAHSTVIDSIVGHRAAIGAGAQVSALSVIGDDFVVEAGEVLSGICVPAEAPR